jgi:hypothetical protein
LFAGDLSGASEARRLHAIEKEWKPDRSKISVDCGGFRHRHRVYNDGMDPRFMLGRAKAHQAQQTELKVLACRLLVAGDIEN